MTETEKIFDFLKENEQKISLSKLDEFNSGDFDDCVDTKEFFKGFILFVFSTFLFSCFIACFIFFDPYLLSTHTKTHLSNIPFIIFFFLMVFNDTTNVKNKLYSLKKDFKELFNAFTTDDMFEKITIILSVVSISIIALIISFVFSQLFFIIYILIESVFFSQNPAIDYFLLKFIFITVLYFITFCFFLLYYKKIDSEKESLIKIDEKKKKYKKAVEKAEKDNQHFLDEIKKNYFSKNELMLMEVYSIKNNFHYVTKGISIAQNELAKEDGYKSFNEMIFEKNKHSIENF